MNPKASSTLEKAYQDRRRSNFKKALSRLEDGVNKFPKELRLYTEAIDVSMEAGEPVKALQFYKKAYQRLPEDAFELWSFAAEKVGVYNDAIVGRFLVEQAIKKGELSPAHTILENLKDHTVDELLQRVRTKRQTLSSAVGGGFAARDELATNALTDALVCLRLNRFSDAVDGIVRILEEAPRTHKILEPFLVELEKRNIEKGEASYVLGCCYIASDKYSRGMEKLVRAAKCTPSLAPDVTNRIESLGEHPDITRDDRDSRLAELYMAGGDEHRAAQLLRRILENDPAKGTYLIDILTPRVECVGNDIELHFLFVDAALALGRKETAVAQLRKIYEQKRHRSDLLEWLESKFKEHGAGTELMLFFAETALGEGMPGKAIEIFKEILSYGVQDEPTIKELLSRHQSVPLVQHFYNDRFGASRLNGKASSFEFEAYDKIDLSSDGATEEADTQETTPEEPISPAPMSDFRVDEFALTEEPARQPDPEGAGFENRDFSLSMGEDPGDGESRSVIPRDDHANETDATPDHRSDLFEYLGRDFDEKAPTEDDTQPPDRAEEADERSERQSLFDTNIDDRVDDRFTDSSPPQDDVVELPSDEEQGEEEQPQDFDSLYEMFLDDRLDTRKTIELIQVALDTERLDEMKKLLSFEPGNLGEETTRTFFLAEYYLAREHPLPALVALRTIHLSGLSAEERKKYLMRTAACYQRLHNYEAANAVYLRILSEHPGLASVEAIAKTNYDKYLQTIAGAAPVLEKVTSL